MKTFHFLNKAEIDGSRTALAFVLRICDLHTLCCHVGCKVACRYPKGVCIE